MNKLNKESVIGISALLVHAAKIDEIYSEHEKSLVKNFIKSYLKDDDTNKILEKAENTFISSTFWGERIGFTAALSSIKEFKRLKVFNKIEKNGKLIKSAWLNLSKKYDIQIKVNGTNAIPSFEFFKNHLERKTFLTQEMLKNKILASNIIYITIYHTKDNIKKYLSCLDKIFKDISNNKIKNKLNSKICYTPINRIN